MRDDRPAKTSRRRRLTEDEIELWLSVAQTVARRPGAVLPAQAPAPTAVVAAPAPPPKKVPVRPTAAPYQPIPLAPSPPKLAPLERRVKQRLARGRLEADAAIDLHGFRQAEALSALRAFLHKAQRDGARIVLVVTGKGGRHIADERDAYDFSAGGVGVLKRSVPLWLAQPDFRGLVVGFEEAGRPHGGAGALYVRLRRRDRASRFDD